MNVNLKSLDKNAVVHAMIWNIQKDVVFLSFNTGYSGVIIDEYSLWEVQDNHKINDFIHV